MLRAPARTTDFLEFGVLIFGQILIMFLPFRDYSTVLPVGFLRFGEGTLATYGPGSSRIVKFLRKMKVLKPE